MRTFSEWISDIRDNMTNGSMSTKITDSDNDTVNITNGAIDVAIQDQTTRTVDERMYRVITQTNFKI